MWEILQNLSQDYLIIVLAIIAYLVYKIISRICKCIELIFGKHKDPEEKTDEKIGGESDDTSSKSPKD